MFYLVYLLVNYKEPKLISTITFTHLNVYDGVIIVLMRYLSVHNEYI